MKSHEYVRCRRCTATLSQGGPMIAVAGAYECLNTRGCKVRAIAISDAISEFERAALLFRGAQALYVSPIGSSSVILSAHMGGEVSYGVVVPRC